jgi:pyrroloquinoline-quinone synthase
MSDRTPWTHEEFEAKLREKSSLYHFHHPFHQLMHDGKMTKEQVQGWVANRYYYQTAIPVKDAAIMSNCTDREVRRHWVQRILDHDGHEGHGSEPADAGGIEAWLQLGEAVGLTREELESEKHVLPAVRFAIDAYINFAKQQPWQVAASSSLTELFAPKIHKHRLDHWPSQYPWIEEKGYSYFKKRLHEAPRDVMNGLQITMDYYKTREQQEFMLTVLQFKLDVLWTMCDAMWMAYVENRPPYCTELNVERWQWN